MQFADKSRLITLLPGDFATINSDSSCMFSDIHFLWFVTQRLWKTGRKSNYWRFLRSKPYNVLQKTELLPSEVPWHWPHRAGLSSSVQLLDYSYASFTYRTSGTKVSTTVLQLKNWRLKRPRLTNRWETLRKPSRKIEKHAKIVQKTL